MADGSRLLVYPASQRIYREAMAEGIADVVTEAGGVFNPSSCGACFGGMGGVLDEGEVCVSTSNRNFPGRMGHVESKSYLVSPVTAAVTCLYGELVDPREHLSSNQWAAFDEVSQQGLEALA
jgi:3-isopropylmalate/(R)-2-methylmalate dehydratase large subunit